MTKRAVELTEFPEFEDAGRTIVLSCFREALKQAYSEVDKGDVTLRGALKKVWRGACLMNHDQLECVADFFPENVGKGKRKVEAQRLEAGINWALDQSPAGALLADLKLKVVVREEVGYGMQASIVDAFPR